jgi:hypothetical protein
VALAGGDLGFEAVSHQPATVSKRSRSVTRTLPSRVAAIRASRARRAAAMSKPTRPERSLPACRQQTAYLPLDWR